MYTAMKSIFEDKNRQEALFFSGPGKDLEVQSICLACEGLLMLLLLYRLGACVFPWFWTVGHGPVVHVLDIHDALATP